MPLNQIVDAIQHKKRLQIHYPPGSRLIEPHTLGFSKDGHQLLRAFQVSGASESNEHKDWKLFRLDKLTSQCENGDTFAGPRSGYKKGDKAMKGGIISEL